MRPSDDEASRPIAEAVAQAARDVLETMFFTMVLDDQDGELAQAGQEGVGEAAGESWFAVTVRFAGDRSGWLSLRLSGAAARTMAANFLGVDEADDAQADGVMCELGNMICGAAVSRLDVGGDFLLDAPVSGWHSQGEGVGLRLPLEEGVLNLEFHLVPEGQPELAGA